MYVRAFVGPRPVYSASSRTTALEIAELTVPTAGGASCVPDMHAPLLASLLLMGYAKGRKETDGIRPRNPRFSPYPTERSDLNARPFSVAISRNDTAVEKRSTSRYHRHRERTRCLTRRTRA